MQTQYQLATLKKGSESITEYFNKAQNLVASLGAAGHPFSPSKFFVYLLARLGTDYESLVTFLTTRPDPISPHQLYSFLLNHESRLSHQQQNLLGGNPITVYATTSKSPSSSPNLNRARGSRHSHGRHG